MACNEGCGYGVDLEQARAIVYRDPVTHHLHELRGVSGQIKWTHTDLTQVTGAPPADCFANGYAWKAGNSVQVVFSTWDDGHVHALYRYKGGTWAHADLTAKTGAPPMPDAVGLVNAYAWEGITSKQIVYWDAQSKHVIELFAVAGDPHGWQWADLTAIAGAPPVSNSSFMVNGYAWEGLHAKQVVFWDLAGQIHELYTTGGAWTFADLTDIIAKSGGPPLAPIQAVIAGFAFEAGHSKHVVFQHESSRVYELLVPEGGTWWFQEATTELPQSPGGISPIDVKGVYAWESGQSRQIVFQSTDGHIQELIHPVAGSWTPADRSAAAGL